MTDFSSPDLASQLVYTNRDWLPYAVLQSALDEHGVSEIVRGAINEMITCAYADARGCGRRVLAFTVDFDTRPYELSGLRLSIRALTATMADADG